VLRQGDAAEKAAEKAAEADRAIDLQVLTARKKIPSRYEPKGKQSPMAKSYTRKKRVTMRVVTLPDLEHAKSAVLTSLTTARERQASSRMRIWEGSLGLLVAVVPTPAFEAWRRGFESCCSELKERFNTAAVLPETGTRQRAGVK
jgi:hypothetical protein